MITLPSYLYKVYSTVLCVSAAAEMVYWLSYKYYVPFEQTNHNTMAVRAHQPVD